MIFFSLRKIVCFLSLIVTHINLESIQLQCENYEEKIWTKQFGIICLMTNSTKIDSTDAVFSSKYESVSILSFSNNTKVSYLPRKINEAFPNLINFKAVHCSIKAISKENFAKLDKLKFLFLPSNEIEEIKDDTFEDLISLEFLILSIFFLFFK